MEDMVKHPCTTVHACLTTYNSFQIGSIRKALSDEDLAKNRSKKVDDMLLQGFLEEVSIHPTMKC